MPTSIVPLPTFGNLVGVNNIAALFMLPTFYQLAACLKK